LPVIGFDRGRLALLRAEAHRVLAGNWREGSLADGTPYGFTCPAPPRYRHQWYWDSCLHAIVWRHFQPARDREELRTLMRGGRPDGFIPHTIFWHDGAGWRRAPFCATHSLRGDRGTAHIQTPLLALAWEPVAAMSPDEPEFATEALDGLRLHYDWLVRHRDPDGDGLISIIQPRRIRPGRLSEVRRRVRVDEPLPARLLLADRALAPAPL
jgi:hypothetical protein